MWVSSLASREVIALEGDARRGSRAAAHFGDFTCSTALPANIRTSALTSRLPFALCTDPDTRPARTSRPRGTRRPDLHPGRRDTPAPAVHRAPRLHRARVRQPAQWSCTHGSERRFRGTDRCSRRVRRRRHRRAGARPMQTGHRVFSRRSHRRGGARPRRPHRDAPFRPRP